MIGQTFVTSEAGQDALAIARALRCGDRGGAWEVLGPKDASQRLGVTVCLAVFLAHLIGDHEEAWLDLAEVASSLPDARVGEG